MEQAQFDISQLAKKLYPLNEDEYEKDGFPYCKKCNTPRFCKIGRDDAPPFITRTHCECQQAEIKARKEQELIEKRKADFRARQKLSMIGEKYLDATLDIATITKSNEPAYKSARAYVEQAQAVLSNNIGLYIYGDNSSGKTYLMACICNALVEKGYSCEFTSIPKLLAETGRSVRENRMSQAEIVDNLARKKFVFIDDLGKEFLGDRSDYNWKKAERLLLDVLNARYSNGLPTVFTSNYSLEEFAEKFGLDKAIIERVNEMATRVIRLDGDNFRMIALQEKMALAKRLGI